MSDHSGNGKIVDLKSARKKAPSQTTTSKRSGANGRDAAYERALKAQRGQKGGMNVGGVRWVHYLQVIGLLLLVAWMMHTCNM